MRSFNFCVDSLGLSRRMFLSVAFACTTLLGGSFGDDKNNIEQLGDESVKPSKKKAADGRSLPVYLSQKSYAGNTNTPAKLVAVIRSCRDEWNFAGMELSLSTMITNCAGSSFDVFLEELRKELGKDLESSDRRDFCLSLSVDLDGTENALDLAEKVTKAVALRGLSIALSEKTDPGKIASEILEWHKRFCGPDCVCKPQLMLETPDVYAGLELMYLAKLLKDIPTEIGILIRSSASHYRFDLAIQDLQFALKKEPESKNFNRQIAARFNIDVSSNRTPQRVEFEREMFRRAIVDRLVPNAQSPTNPIFVSVESSLPLDFQAGASGARANLGNRHFSDLVESMMSELRTQ